MTLDQIDAIDIEGCRARELGAILSCLAECERFDAETQQALEGLSYVAQGIYGRLAVVTNGRARK